MAMILKFVTKNGTKVYGPPYWRQPLEVKPRYRSGYGASEC